MSNETPWSTLAAGLTRLSDRLDALPTIREATIVSLVPLAVQFDTDTSNTIVQGSLVSGVTPGYRVLTLKLRHYVWILGIKGGDNLGGMAGEIRMFAGTTPPAGGWLLCRGQAVSRVDYAALYNTLGNTYGAGNGTTTFNIPNLQGRVVVGKNPTDSDFNLLGLTGGTKKHNHWQTVGLDGNYLFTRQAGVNGLSGTSKVITVPRGVIAAGQSSGAARFDTTEDESSMQPYVVMDYIIKT